MGVRPIGSLALVLVLSVSACEQGMDRKERVVSAGGSTRVAVTDDDLSLPDGCRPAQVAQLLVRFFDAFNRGDATAARFVAFGDGTNGGWYSMSEGNPRGGRRHFVTSTGAELRAYFAARHLRRDRLMLREVIVGYANGLGHIEFRLTRRADDLRKLGITTSRVEGKGAVDCERRKIVVFSMGMSDSVSAAHTAPLCPRARTARSVPLACVRHWGG